MFIEIGGLTPTDYLNHRTRRANREQFESVLAKVKNGEPEEHDRL